MGIDTHVFVVLLIVVGLVFLDWLVGILLAVRAGTFSFNYLPHQLATFVLPYVGSLLVLAILQAFSHFITVSGVVGALDGGFYAAASGTALKAITDIIGKAAELGGTPPANLPKLLRPAA